MLINFLIRWAYFHYKYIIHRDESELSWRTRINMAKRHKRILVILAAQPFQKEHIPKGAHSKKGTFSIPKRAHSKKGTFQKGHIPKKAHSKKATFQKGHIQYSKKSTFQKEHIPKRPHSKRAHSKKATFQKGHKEIEIKY